MVKQRTVVGLLSLAIFLCAPNVLAAPMPINDASIRVAAINIADNPSDSSQAVKYINVNARALDKRAPPVTVPNGPTPEGPTTPKEVPSPPVVPPTTTDPAPPVTTDPKPPVTTDPKPPVTTDPKPPVTTDPKPPITTDPKPSPTPVKTTSSSTTSEAEETTSSTKHTTNPKPTGPSKPNPGAPGPHTPVGPVTSTTTTTNSTIPPTATPEKSSGAPILPIVLGSVLGVGVLAAVGAFFFLRFRKGRRFDRKRPLSFLAVSLDDPSGSDRHLSTSSSGGALAGALAVARGELDRDNDEIRYSPPTPIGANNNRFSYQSSDNSGPAVTWNPDDENAALVASSMMPLAANDPRHQRLSGRQQIQQGAFSPEPEMRELTPGQLRVVGGSPELSRSEVQPVQEARESLDVRPEGDVRSQHGSIRSSASGKDKDPKSDDIMYL
ncbi:hypothetical protein BG000_004341 [Podila horticola]|nr:hypothetical protein BG000_004341 [Podila horticola]